MQLEFRLISVSFILSASCAAYVPTSSSGEIYSAATAGVDGCTISAGEVLADGTDAPPSLPLGDAICVQESSADSGKPSFKWKTCTIDGLQEAEKGSCDSLVKSDSSGKPQSYYEALSVRDQVPLTKETATLDCSDGIYGSGIPVAAVAIGESICGRIKGQKKTKAIYWNECTSSGWKTGGVCTGDPWHYSGKKALEAKNEDKSGQ